MTAERGGALLVNVDSVIPNLALMHISSWRKSEGIPASFSMEDPSEVWASVILRKHRHRTDGLRYLYPDAMIDIGGTGYDLHKRLPDGVDEMMPDYSLYPGMEYDLGFTSRGCDRGCPFCFVRPKEGRYRRTQHPSEFHDPAHKAAILMDNNILLDPDWFLEVTGWYMEHSMAVSYNQGLDARLVTREIAERLRAMRKYEPLHFSFDSWGYADDCERTIRLLKDAGISPRSTVWQVYCSGEDDVEDCAERCMWLKRHGACSYPMIDGDIPVQTRRMKALRHWARMECYWSVDWEEYKRTNGLR